MSIEKKRKVWTQILIMTIAIVMMVIIWPARLLKHTIHSNPMEDAPAVEREFTYNDKLLQTFTPQCDYLKQIRLYMNCQSATAEDTITFVLYNSQYAPVFQSEYACKDLVMRDCLDIKTDLELVPGEVCYYEILLSEGSRCHLTVSLGERATLGQIEDGILFDQGTPDDVHSYWAEYTYVQPLSHVRTFVYYIAILVVAGILYFGITNLWVQFPKSFEMTGSCIRTIAAVIVAGLVLAALYFAVWKNIFGGAPLDRLVYGTGIVSAGVWAFICIYHKKPSYVEAIAATSAVDVWRSYLQTLCFAGVIYMNCMYANATELKYQYENTRWMLICLGLALLTFMRLDWHNKKDRIFTGIGLVWFVGALIYAVKYVQAFATDNNSFYLAKLYMAVMVIWGIVIIYACSCLKKEYFTVSLRNIGIMQWLQIVTAVVFAVGMCVYRYKKVWPFEVVIPVIVLLVMGLRIEDKGRMLRNLCNGILLAFVLMTGNSLLYRPYMRWTYYRYPGYFHTVACTGMFLTIVVCAALIKFYIKAHGSEHIFRDTWKELFFGSVAFIYVFLTMSRTAFMAIGALFIGIVILTMVVYHKKWKQFFMEIGLLVGVTILAFPMVYSATRMIPALVNKPYHFEPVEPSAEEYEAMLAVGDPIDSDKYMNMERFLTLFAARIQLPEVLTAKETKEDVSIAASEESTVDAAYYDEIDEEVSVTSSEVKEAEEQMEEDEEDTADVEAEDTFEVSKGITNGRMDIFMSYISAFNLKGHEKMGYQSPDGTKDYGHAHNSYIQVMYDFGIPTGIMFLFLCFVTFINSIYVTVKLGNKMEYALLLFGLVVVFGVVSVTEWAFHPSIPIGFTFLWSVGMLMGTGTDKNVQK